MTDKEKSGPTRGWGEAGIKAGPCHDLPAPRTVPEIEPVDISNCSQILQQISPTYNQLYSTTFVSSSNQMQLTDSTLYDIYSELVLDASSITVESYNPLPDDFDVALPGGSLILNFPLKEYILRDTNEGLDVVSHHSLRTLLRRLIDEPHLKISSTFYCGRSEEELVSCGISCAWHQYAEKYRNVMSNWSSEMESKMNWSKFQRFLIQDRDSYAHVGVTEPVQGKYPAFELAIQKSKIERLIWRVAEEKEREQNLQSEICKLAAIKQRYLNIIEKDPKTLPKDIADVQKDLANLVGTSNSTNLVVDHHILPTTISLELAMDHVCGLGVSCFRGLHSDVFGISASDTLVIVIGFKSTHLGPLPFISCAYPSLSQYRVMAELITLDNPSGLEKLENDFPNTKVCRYLPYQSEKEEALQQGWSGIQSYLSDRKAPNLIHSFWKRARKMKQELEGDQSVSEDRNVVDDPIMNMSDGNFLLMVNNPVAFEVYMFIQLDPSIRLNTLRRNICLYNCGSVPSLAVTRIRHDSSLSNVNRQGLCKEREGIKKPSSHCGSGQEASRQQQQQQQQPGPSAAVTGHSADVHSVTSTERIDSNKRKRLLSETAQSPSEAGPSTTSPTSSPSAKENLPKKRSKFDLQEQ